MRKRAAALGVVLTAFALATSGSVASAETPGTSLTQTLTIDARQCAYPAITSALDLRGPSSSALASSLGALPKTVDGYRLAVSELVGGLRWGNPPVKSVFEQTFVLGSNFIEPPEPRPAIDGDTATVHLSSRETLWDLRPRVIGFWSIQASGDELIFTAAEPTGIPPDTTIAFSVRTMGASVAAASPVPTRRHASSELDWKIPYLSPPRRPQFAVKAAQCTHRLLTSNDGRWFSIVQPIANALGVLIVVPVLIVVLLKAGWREDALRVLPRTLIYTTAAGVIIAGLVIAYRLRSDRDPKVLGAILIAATIFGGSAVLLLAIRGVRRRRAWLATLLTVAALVALAGVVAWLGWRSQQTYGPTPYLWVHFGTCAVIVLAAVGALTRRACPRAGDRREVARGGLALVGLCLAILVAWHVAAASVNDNYDLHATLGYADDPYFSDELNWMSSPDDLVAQLLLSMLDLLPVAVLAGIVWQIRTEARPGVLFREGDKAPQLLVLGFAAYVAGTWSWLYSIRLPVAFIVAAVLLWIIVRPRHPAASPELVAITQFSVERRQRIFHPYAPTAWDSAPAPDERRKLPGAAIGTLGSGFLGATPADPRGSGHPQEYALGLGPGLSWWANAKIAVRIGMPLALIPAVHYLYLLISAGGPDQIERSAVGVLVVFVWILNEYLFWLVAAFTLGGLYAYLPGRTGMQKGFVLGCVYAASQFAVELLPGTYDVLSWFFVALETGLTLVLVGLAMDALSVRRRGGSLHTLGELYHLRTLRSIVGYASPAILALLFLLQQAITGNSQEALNSLLQSAPTFIPGR